MSTVYLSYTQAELDDCYDQRVWARDAAGSIGRLGPASAAVRASIAHAADLSYGPAADERIDWFHGAPGGPIHLHVHGGAWRNLAKHDASFGAAPFVAEGVHYVVANFSKLPGVRLPDVVEQLARAMAFVHAEAAHHGADPARILLSGHSSGAHLAAVLCTLDWRARGLPADAVAAGLCVGGMYDLEPVLLSARSSYVTLSPDEAERLSPVRHAGAIRCPMTLVHGERESPEFVRQARTFADALRAASRPVSLLAMPDSDHFDINDAFGVAGSVVHRAALDAIAGMRPGAGRDAA